MENKQYSMKKKTISTRTQYISLMLVDRTSAAIFASDLRSIFNGDLS
jgi:hypothetical protein